jgi:citrate lyase subunit beta/citryl-CoA lyase
VADGVILDLEDAVGQDIKSRARTDVLAFLEQGARLGKQLAVRINPADSLTGLDDLLALAQS